MPTGQELWPYAAAISIAAVLRVPFQMKAAAQGSDHAPAAALTVNDGACQPELP